MKMRLRVRLLLMVGIPLAGMLFLAGWNTVEKIFETRDLARLQALVEVSTQIGMLTHELQKERGMSAGFIGSEGRNFAEELKVQHGASDRRQQELQAVLTGFDASHFGASFATQLAASTQLLNELSAKRQVIAALSIPGPEAIAYYTRSIAALLGVSGQLATLSQDKDIARQASAYSALLQAKERAGIERAMLSNVFGADRFTPETLVRFISNGAAQDTWYGIFNHYASAQQQQFAMAQLQGAAVDAVAETKNAALARMSEESLGLDAKSWFVSATGRIDLMKAVEDRLAADLVTAMADLERQSSQIAWFYAISTLVSAFIILLLTHLIGRRILGQMGGEPEAAVAVAHAVADGKLDNEIVLAKGDSTSLLASMQRMQAQLLERITAERRVAAENLRIRIALDNVSTGVMIADAERKIIYANQAVVAVLSAAEEDIRQQLPDFDAQRLVGANIDSFHKVPTQQARLLAELTQTYVANVEVGRRHMTVSANPVIDADGNRLGAVAEWRDRTQEVNAQRELKALLDAAVNGDFSQSIPADDKQGFFNDMAAGMNQLMAVVAQALNDIARVLNAVAHGDLSQQIETEYSGTLGQLKDDTNSTIQRLREVVGQIQDATEAINTAAKEIAAGNTDLSARTEEQASSLEETASSMEQIKSTVKHNADNARAAAELADSSNAVATRGGEMVGRVVETMSGIQGSSRKIADIIGVIDSIAFQTNILALNAAVEAARAGEQGRGFAVVATEVRNLAKRSADAAKEIKGLIDESVGKVNGGVRLVHETGETIAEVVSAFRQLAQLVGGISDASHEQASGIEQVSEAVAQMDEVTQQNAALVEQAAAAAESLEEQARGLQQAVAMFSLDDVQTRAAVRRSVVAPAPTFAAAAAVTPMPMAKRDMPLKHLPAARFVDVDDDGDVWAEF
jgi:methyl-accepting chemotaxis protein